MSGYVLFQMWGPFRQSLIASHLFYVEQAKKRLLSQFLDIESEAEKATEAWLEESGRRFNPDFHDPGDFYEAAHHAGIEFYELLTDMRDQTKLSVLAGMYHEWDKQLRKWLTDEIRHWHTGDGLASKVWTVDFGKLADLLENLGWSIRNKDYFSKLDACRLIVNVYKHGKGNSLNDLKKSYPEYLPGPLDSLRNQFLGLDLLDYNNLLVSDDQLQSFSGSIVAFWKDVPENIFDSDDISAPAWFESARLRDLKVASQLTQGGAMNE